MIQDNSSYVFVQNGPEVPKDEIENINSSSCEVKIFWKDDLIKFITCDPKQSFTVGESLNCNFNIPGIEKLTLISPANNGVIVTEPNDNQIILSLGGKSIVNISDFKFEISLTNSGKRIAGKHNINKESIFFVMLSLMVHGMFLAAVFFYTPALSASEDGEMSNEQRFLLKQYLAAAAEKELKQEEPNVVENNPILSGGETGAKSKGSEGTMGNYSATSNKGYGVAGPQNNPDPHIARQNALKDAMEFGMIGLISSGAGGNPEFSYSALGQR